MTLNTTCGPRAHTRRQRTQAPAQTTIHTSIRALPVSVTALMENMIELAHSKGWHRCWAWPRSRQSVIRHPEASSVSCQPLTAQTQSLGTSLQRDTQHTPPRRHGWYCHPPPGPK